MNIFINMRSHVIVNHIHGILNVNTTRGNRSDYLDGTVPTFECQKDILTFALVSIIMDRGAGESVLVQILVKAIEQRKYIKKESYARKMIYVPAFLLVSSL